MICRIDRVVDGDNLIVLRISGKLTGEHVATLRSVLHGEGGPVAIDLKEVSLVDCEAVQLLALAEYNQTELRSCPAYIREWVTRENSEKRGCLSEQGREVREDIEDA